MTNQADDLLTVRETARLLGVHENTVRNWARTGALPEARIPGSRFHRFLASDVERLRKQRGQAAPSLMIERRSVNPELATASQLHRWPGDASKDAQQNLPEVIRRLLAESPGITDISVRTGDGTALSGWDAVATSTGTAFLPAGRLGIELGVSKDVKGKADDDYQNRLRPGRQDITFVFVTPRRWRDKEAWASRRRSEDRFRNVKVLDADDLEGWLKASPAAHYWVSEHFNLKPRDARTIEDWWRRFHEQTKPVLPSALFLAGRSGLAKQLVARTQDKPNLTTIQSESLEDCLGFTFAAFHDSDNEADGTKAVVVVSSSDVWDRIIEQPGESVLVPLFYEANVSAALDAGHHVISVIDRTAVARRAVDITLPRVDRRAAAQAFEKDGLEYRAADRLAVLGRRSLPALKRSIALDPKFKRPSWAHDDSAGTLACLVLASSWTTSEYDFAILEQLTGQPRQDLERVIRAASSTSDPVLRRVGSTWMVLSPEEALLYLAEAMNSGAMWRWHETVLRLLLEPDPTLDMTSTERLAAQMEGQRRQISRSLAHGLANGIALLGAMGGGVTVDGGDSLADHAHRCVRDLLAQAERDETGRSWRQLAGVLPLLAEAAPDEFLRAVDDDLRRQDPRLLSLFREDKDDALTLGSGSLHPHLLWALETVCWSDEHLVEGMRTLALLSVLEPGGKSGNRPSHSMATILCGWSRNTGASQQTRLHALDAVIAASEDVGWQLLLDLWPSHHGFVMAPAAPHVRDDWIPSSSSVNVADWADFAHELVVRALRLVPGQQARLSALIENLSPIAAADRGLVIHLVERELTTGLLSDSDQLELWDSLRSEVRKHQRFPDADWAMPSDVVSQLDDLVTRFEPSASPEQHAYLFGWHPDLPGVDQRDYEAYAQHLRMLRTAALHTVLQNDDGWDQLAALTKRCAVPGQLGWALTDIASVGLEDVPRWLASPEDPLRDAAFNFTRRYLSDHGESALHSALRMEGLEGDARALFLRCVPSTSASWRELDDSPQADDAAAYWRTASIDVVPGPDVSEAVTRLIAYGRAWTGIEVVSYALHADKNRSDGEPTSLNRDLVLSLLEQAVKQSPSEMELVQMSGYNLGEALDYLVEQDASHTDIARFEFAFHRLLEHHRAPVVLKRALATQPELFVDLVQRIYRAKNEPRREKSEVDSNAATQAWYVIRGWHGFPGQSEEGGFDPELLNAWVRAARLALSDADRADIGDEVIGETFGRSPVGSDGVWPAQPLRDLIESIGSRELENGIIIGRLNSRGVTSRAQYDGGQQEHTLSDQYRDWSKQTKAQWPRTSRILQSIAESYERDAKREDTRAELDADRM